MNIPANKKRRVSHKEKTDRLWAEFFRMFPNGLRGMTPTQQREAFDKWMARHAGKN